MCARSVQVQPWIQPRSTAKSSEKLEQKILFPIDDLSNSEHSYIFLMTGDGQFLYGVCVSQEELLSVPTPPAPYYRLARRSVPPPLSLALNAHRRAADRQAIVHARTGLFAARWPVEGGPRV